MDGLLDGGGRGLRPPEGVEHHEVVDDGVVTHGRDRDAGLEQTPGVGLSLVAEHVVLVHDQERRREAGELLERGTQR